MNLKTFGLPSNFRTAPSEAAVHAGARPRYIKVNLYVVASLHSLPPLLLL